MNRSYCIGYTHGFAQTLANRHDVHVLTRRGNTFLPDYKLCEERGRADPNVAPHVISLAQAMVRA